MAYSLRFPQTARIEVSLERKRGLDSAAYMRAIAGEESERAMLYWIAEACKETRLEAKRHLIHIAASLEVNQSTMTRYERHESQPRSIDRTVAAYAEDLQVDPQQLWARAVEMWIASENQTGTERVAHAATDARRASAPTPERKPRKQTAKQRRQVGEAAGGE